MYRTILIRRLQAVLIAMTMITIHSFVWEHADKSSSPGQAFTGSVAFASEGGGSGGESENIPRRIREPQARKPQVRKPQARKPRGTSGLSNARTSAATRILQQGRRSCGRLAKEYRADCVAQVFKEAAAKLTTRAYQPARAQLRSAARKIRSRVSRNVDRSKPAIRHRGRKVRAVKKSAVRTVNAAAAKIVRETETKLIRSAGASRDRKVHFTRIAKVAGSTKVILRS